MMNKKPLIRFVAIFVAVTVFVSLMMTYAVNFWSAA